MAQPFAILSDRGVVGVSGADAEKLLQGLITNDVPAQSGHATYAGLLTPQGKIQFDFFVLRTDDGFLIDVARDKAADLAKRLTIYRLRSKADIADRSDALAVRAYWDDVDPRAADGVHFYRDPRLPQMRWRAISPAEDTPVTTAQSAGEQAYHAHRIALGVPEGGRDYVFGDTFPHEALFDQLHGVSFTKGCYVGQEIVSRMQHRGTARKRIVPVTGEGDLPASGTDVTAGDVVIGTLGSTAGRDGLALVRLDRAAEFKAKGVSLTAGSVPIALRKPAFATFELEPARDAAAQPS